MRLPDRTTIVPDPEASDLAKEIAADLQRQLRTVASEISAIENSPIPVPPIVAGNRLERLRAEYRRTAALLERFLHRDAASAVYNAQLATANSPTNMDLLKSIGCCSNQALLAQLVSAKYPAGFACPRCANADAHWDAARRRWHCRKCGALTSLLAGTALASTHTALRTWFAAAAILSAAPGMTASAFAQAIGIKRPQTAARILNLLRSATANRTPMTVGDLAEILAGNRIARQPQNVGT
jgi:ribosomal protein L37AE/L43A